MSGTAKPEIRYFSEDPAFLGDGIREYDIKGRKSICRYNQHRFGIYRIDIADFPLMNPLEAPQSGAEHGRRL
jgi:hypothetical protein